MIGGHVTPIDHQYYYPNNWVPDPNSANLKEVLAPGDGIITSIQSMPVFFSHKSNDSNLGDYRIILAHTCTFYTIYIHIYQLSPKLKEALGDIDPSENKRVSIPVSAGEVIGRANSFDFSVHNEDVTLKGFIVPAHYEREPWKIHTVDPFDYFVEPLRTQLLKFDLRQAEPRGGKIDYDIDGKLIGNWFKENTNGYQGIKQPDYWVTHLAIAPEALDPKQIILSLGDFQGEPKQFSVKGNSPDPKDVDLSFGLVKYELVDTQYILGDSKEFWNRVSYADNIKASGGDLVHGVVLLQLIEDRKLKVEIFPKKTKVDVSNFTDKAIIYER